MDMDMDVDMDMDMDIDVYHRPNLELACNVGCRLFSFSFKIMFVQEYRNLNVRMIIWVIVRICKRYYTLCFNVNIYIK